MPSYCSSLHGLHTSLWRQALNKFSLFLLSFFLSLPTPLALIRRGEGGGGGGGEADEERKKLLFSLEAVFSIIH